MGALIIIRGNSGSGKTTVARALQYRLGHGTMLVSQDVVRREILYIKDSTPGPTKDLLERMVRFGLENGRTVIIEGILANHKYGDLLRGLAAEATESYVYYFDLPFDETLRRHETKPNAHEFGEAEMREWWKEKDYLGVPGEEVIGETVSEEGIIASLLDDIKNVKPR